MAVSQNFNTLCHGWYLFLEKCAAFFTSRIIVVSEHDKLSGLRCGIGSPSKYSMVRYGIHMQEFEDKCPSLRGCFGIPAGTLVVGMVACFKPQKAVSDFVAVARGVCSSETGVLFMIAGDGAQRARIEKLIKRYGLEGRIILLGWRRDIARFISSCDVFMLTSLWEGMPISVIEAMAASLPVIVTDTGGVKELIRDGENGFLIRPGNIPEMEKKLLMLLRNTDMRTQIGQKAHDSLEGNYSLGQMAAETQRLYELAMGGCRVRPHAVKAAVSLQTENNFRSYPGLSRVEFHEGLNIRKEPPHGTI